MTQTTSQQRRAKYQGTFKIRVSGRPGMKEALLTKDYLLRIERLLYCLCDILHVQLLDVRQG